MSEYTTLRPPASAALLVELGRDCGVSEAECLTGTQLTMTYLDQVDAEVRFEDELTIIRNLLGAVDDPSALGVQAGLRCHAASPGIWGFVLMSSSTLGEAMATGVSLAALSFCLCRLRITAGDANQVRLILDPSTLPVGLRRFAVERDCIGIQTLQRDILMSPDLQLSVTLAMAPPTPRVVEMMTSVLGVEPEFDAAENSLIVSADSLATQLPLANRHALAIAEHQARALLQQRTSRAGVAGLLRDIMLAGPTPVMSLEQAARRLAVSPRTLRRHLSDEGVTLRTLQDETRLALAEQLLADGDLSISEISRRLGYAQAGSFTKAFRRWKGTSPVDYRNDQPTNR